VWSDLENTPAKQHFGVIQRHVGQMHDTLASGLSFTVMPALAKKVASLEYRMINRESLETDIHPFSFGNHTKQERQHALEVDVYRRNRTICECRSR